MSLPAERRRSALPDTSSADLEAELQRLDASLRDQIDSRDSYYRKSRRASEGLLKAGLGIMAGGFVLSQAFGEGPFAWAAIGVGLVCSIACTPMNMVLSAVLIRKNGQIAPLAARRLEVARRRVEVAGAEEELREAQARYDRIIGETERLKAALASAGGRIEDLGAAVWIGGVLLDKREGQ